MPKSLDPQTVDKDHSSEQQRWARSLHETVNGGIDIGTPTGQDSNGVYNEFSQGNQTGVLIRVGAAGSSEPIQWVTANVGVAINHKLLRKPIGFKIVDKDKTVDIYRTAPPTENTITLASTDATVNVTIYVF